MKRFSLREITLMALAALVTSCGETETKPVEESLEKTAFQTSAPWDPAYDVRSDVAIVYGTRERGGMTFEQRVESYRERGYKIHFMTGSAWGHPNYVRGDEDGKTHYDEGQVRHNGDTVVHSKDDPYMVPTKSFTAYLQQQAKRAIDAGALAIHMEEPEFWAWSGYSDGFKREWQEYYGEPWKGQHLSPEATYQSSKLKYHLYYRHLYEISKFVKEYAKEIGRDVKFFVPTHSLINYSNWHIISPEASLASIPYIDGYIAQVWTGTSRSPVYYDGEAKERVFENAFLEYGSMISMTEPTGRKIFLLTDPIEDAVRSWADYKDNYQATFTAKVLYPMVNNYEVMPWPSRIYKGKFPVADAVNEDGTPKKEPMPKPYATQLQVMINALNDMPKSDNRVSGSHGIGVMLCNSMMFQRHPEHAGYSDPQLSHYYGMSMPLIKQGIPIESVHYENVGYEATLKDIKVLVASYTNMKPLTSDGHAHIAKWVEKGGVLIYCSRDSDPYQAIKEWWSDEGYSAPSGHLFKLMGIEATDKDMVADYGKGKVYIIRKDPAELVLKAGGDSDYVECVIKAYENDAKAGKIVVKNNFVLERGPYTIAAVIPDTKIDESLTIKGQYIDLFDPEIPVVENPVVAVDSELFLYSTARIEGAAPKVLCGASRNYDEKITGSSFSYVAKSPAETKNVQRIYLEKEPKGVAVKDHKGVDVAFTSDWHAASKTLLLSYENSPEGISVAIEL